MSSDFSYFKLAFFGSSSFVLPILENILENKTQTLIKIAIQQLKNLLENETHKNKKYQENLVSNYSQIQPIWWSNQDFLTILEFILTISLENETADWIENTDSINNHFGQKLESLSEQTEQTTDKSSLQNSKYNQKIENLSQSYSQNQDKINQINRQINKKNLSIPLFLQNNPKTCELIFELNKKIKLELVITQPDRINGKKVIKNPISQFAKNYGLQLEMPIKINSEIEEIKQKYQLDSVIVASFGQILNSKVLNFPKFGVINWHPSLLPKYRGATPIQTALLENQKISGLSWIKMTKGMDSGPIWLQIPRIIKKLDTFETFADKMGELGSKSWALPVIANLIEQIMNKD